MTLPALTHSSRISIWKFDITFGGKLFFWYPDKVPEEFTTRISAKLFSFLAMVTEDIDFEQVWGIIPIPGKHKALIYAYYLKGWNVISLQVDEGLSYWLLQYSTKIIPKIKKLIINTKGQITEKQLKELYTEFLTEIQSLESLGVMDFDDLPR